MFFLHVACQDALSAVDKETVVHCWDEVGRTLSLLDWFQRFSGWFSDWFNPMTRSYSRHLKTPWLSGPNGMWKFPTKNHGFVERGCLIWTGEGLICFLWLFWSYLEWSPDSGLQWFLLVLLMIWRFPKRGYSKQIIQVMNDQFCIETTGDLGLPH